MTALQVEPPLLEAGASPGRAVPPWPWATCLALSSIVGWAAVEVLRITWQKPRLTLYGDQALIALATRRASQFDQLVGPYSREGFHHPGPALFYVLAPFLRLEGGGDRGLFIGAVCINASALAAAVVVVGRRVGPIAAMWTAVCITVLYGCLGIGTLREPWNPYLVVAPTVLLVVLWATAATETGQGILTPWTLVVASFVAQTDVGTVPVVAVLAVALIGIRVRVRRQQEAARRPHKGARLGWAILLLIWIPPLVESVQDHPNNVSLLWSYLSSTRSQAGPIVSGRSALTALGVIPFGNHDYVTVLHRNTPELWATGTIFVVVAVAAVKLAAPRQSGVVRALVLASSGVATIGTVSLMTAPPPIYPYLSEWMAVAPLTLLIGFGLAAIGRVGGGAHLGDFHRPTAWRLAAFVVTPRRLAAVLAAGVLIGGIFAVVSDLRTVPIQDTTGSGPWPTTEAGSAPGKRTVVSDTASLDREALATLPTGTHRIQLVIGAPDLWPYAAGMVLALDQSGVNAAVSPPSWDLYFGSARSAPGDPILYLEPRFEAPTGPLRSIAVTSTAVLYYQPGISG